MQPTILLIRHSNTTYDNRVDALLDPPLDEEGIIRVKRTVKFLAESSYKPERIVSSPLQRALAVAQLISCGNIKVTTHVDAGPWNLGVLQGKLNTVAEPIIDQLKEFPDLVVARGESYRTFYNRWESFLARVMQYVQAKPEHPIFITTHSRNINALQSIIGGNAVGDCEESTPEASVTLLSQDEIGDWSFKLIWDGK